MNVTTDYKINFNQDFTSLSVLDKTGYRLFTISSVDKIEEIYFKENENDDDVRIIERLFNSSLVVVVTNSKPNCLKMLHFKKKQDICNCVYPTNILTIRMNRTRLIVCLAESIHIHDIRNMKILHSIHNIMPSNDFGLCSLSLNSHLAYPTIFSSSSNSKSKSNNSEGNVQIFNADQLKYGLCIKAHQTKLSALNFSSNGVLIATTSIRGTVIRVFCVKNGQKVHEFRRGVKRCVNITSLIFSINSDFLSCSSNTETIHIFKIDSKAIDEAERRSISDDTIIIDATTSSSSSSAEDLNDKISKSKKKINKNESADSTSSSSPSSTTQKKRQILRSSETDDNNLKNNSSKINSSSSAATTVTDTNNSDDKINEDGNGGGGWSDYLTKAVTSYFPSQVYDVFNQDRAFATAQLRTEQNQQNINLKHWCALARIQKETKLLVACEDGFLYIYDFNDSRGGQCKLIRVHDLRNSLEGIIELNMNDNNSSSSDSTTSSFRSLKRSKILKIGNSQINNDCQIDASYAAVLKGNQSKEMTESDKYRNLNDAIDTPTKTIFDDEHQFPPVAPPVRQ